MAAVVAADPQSFTLDKENELRIQVEQTDSVSIRLLQGTAEVFGAELPKDKKFTISGASIAVFTWHGATVEIVGKCHAYVARETPMITNLSIHATFEERRLAAAASTNLSGPRVVIVGSTDSGKSTLAKLLCNYATRRGHQPTLVDLDVGQNGITLPGAIAAISIDRPIDLENGFYPYVPLVYFFGHPSPGENVKYYKLLTSAIAAEVNRRAQKHKLLNDSGIVVNTCGWIDGAGFEIAVHAIEAFDADMVLVIDNDRLHADLQNALQRRSTLIIKLPKSGGVVARSRTFRRNARANKIKEYFYGPLNELSPHSTVIDLKDVVILRVGGDSQLPPEALPSGSAYNAADPTALVPVTPTPVDLNHSILGVSHAQTQDQVLESNVAGFIYVKELNLEKQRLVVLAPSPGPLPGKFLLLSSREIKWLE